MTKIETGELEKRKKHSIKPANQETLDLEQERNRPAKVTEFEDGRLWVHQEVLRLDISVTHTLGMDISQTAEQLVHVHL